MIPISFRRADRFQIFRDCSIVSIVHTSMVIVLPTPGPDDIVYYIRKTIWIIMYKSIVFTVNFMNKNTQHKTEIFVFDIMKSTFIHARFLSLKYSYRFLRKVKIHPNTSP